MRCSRSISSLRHLDDSPPHAARIGFWNMNSTPNGGAFLIGMLVGGAIGISIVFCLQALLLRLAAWIVGERELTFARCLGINAVTFVVNLLFALASYALGLSGLGSSLISLIAQAVIAAAIFSAMIPTSFGKGLAIWFIQIVIVLGIAILLLLATGGLAAMLSRLNPSQTETPFPSTIAVTPTAPNTTGQFLVDALNEVGQMGGAAFGAPPTFGAPGQPVSPAPPGFGPMPYPNASGGFGSPPQAPSQAYPGLNPTQNQSPYPAPGFNPAGAMPPIGSPPASPPQP
jgi:hypothetical protein